MDKIFPGEAVDESHSSQSQKVSKRKKNMSKANKNESSTQR